MNTKVFLVAPYRETPVRKPLWDWCRARWDSEPWLYLLCGETSDEPFNRSATVNMLVRGGVRMYGRPDWLIVADADTAIGPNLAEVMGRVAGVPDGWYIGYEEGRYLSLTESTTKRLIRSDPGGPIIEPGGRDLRMSITSYSGCLVVPFEAFETVGGFDERFRTWGEEDFAFMWALDTLYQKHDRLPGFAVHLYHPHVESERFEHPLYPDNLALANRYAKAVGNPDLMRQLIGERT